MTGCQTSQCIDTHHLLSYNPHMGRSSSPSTALTRQTTPSPTRKSCQVLQPLTRRTPSSVSSIAMPRSASKKVRPFVSKKNTLKCGRFELRSTKIRRQRGYSVGPYQLRCTKFRDEQLAIDIPQYSKISPTKKEKTQHVQSIPSECGENYLSSPNAFIHYGKLLSEMEMEADIDDAQDMRLWPAKNELAFIQLLVDEVKADSSLTKKNSFTSRHWNKLDEEMYKLCKVRYSIARLKQKYQRLKQAFNDFKKLQSHTGFGWNDITNTVTAPDSVWDEYIKAHPRSKRFKKKGLENLELLTFLFNKSQATGLLARASTQGPPTSDEERDLESEFLGVDTQSGPLRDESEPSRSGPSFTGSGGTNSGRKGSHMESALKSWSNANKARTEFYIRQAQKSEASNSESYSMEACLEYLVSMEGISQQQKVKASEQFQVRRAGLADIFGVGVC